MDLQPSEIYMHTQLKIARVLGIWPCPEQTMLWKKILFKAVFYAMLGIKLCTLIAVGCHVYNEWGDLPDPFETIVILTAHVNNIIDMIYIPIKINKFLPLLETMDKHFIIPSNPAEQHVFEEAMKSASFVTMMFFGSSMSTGFSTVVTPFTVNINDTTARPLPYHAVLPFDVSQTSGYWAAYFLLAISFLTMCINATVTCDFFVSLIIKTTCQFQFLQLMFTKIQEEAIQRNIQKEKDKMKNRIAIDRTPSALSAHSLRDKDDKITTGLMKNEEQLNNEMELDSEFAKRLSECVKYHQVMLQFVHDLEIAASPFMLFQMLIYVMFLCINVLVLSSVPVISTAFLATLLFIVCVLLLLLLLCWYGNQLTIQSIQVAQAAYDCNWYDTTLSSKRSVTMVMLRAQKPAKLTAWKFFDVDLETFTTVLRATYSFYQVLHKVYNE